MKKAISIILAVAIMISICSSAVAANEKCSCDMMPVVYVPGFGEPIYLNPGSDDEVSLFPPEQDAIDASIPDIVKAVIFGLLSGNFEAFGKYAINIADTMLKPAACDKEGNAPENTGVDYEPPVNDTHKQTAFPATEDDDEGYFCFLYDWRIDPLENAKLLKEYIDEVKAITKHDKIILTAHSQGNTVVASYLYLYGNSGIEKAVFLSPAYQGLSLIGSIFAQEYSLSEKGDDLANCLLGIMGYEDTISQLVSAVIKEINKAGIVDGILDYLQLVLESQFDRVFEESLRDILGTLPGVWAFVPDEYYETAKSAIFGSNGEYGVFIEKIDNYHYNVQKNIVSILNEVKAGGTAIVIAAGYNISSIPVTKSDAAQSDYLIDTEYMTLGATCAPYGESLGKNYLQKNTACGHNHVSPDGIIDASTCAFPEHTWFVKNNPHHNLYEPYTDFIEWAIRYDGQPTVDSSNLYPQFIQISDGEIRPVQSGSAGETRSNGEIIITSLIMLLKDAFAE